MSIQTMVKPPGDRNPFELGSPGGNAYYKANPQAFQALLAANSGGPKIGDIWSQQDASKSELYEGANFTPIGSTFMGGGTWQAPGGTHTQVGYSGPPIPNAATFGTNLGAYGTGDQGGPGTPSGTTTPTPSPLNYLGLPNYANLGSNFTGGTNSDNPFAGLFGGPDQTNFLSNWT